MRFADQLVRQALHLTEVDPRRPLQANLRRAESAAYYALFHELTDDAAKRFAPGSARRAQQELVRRSFAHGQMAETSQQFGREAQWIRDAGVTVSIDLRRVADAFVLLQQRRHEADYNLSITFDRARSRRTVNLARSALASWRAVRRTPGAEFFLLALLLGRSRRA